MPEMSNKVFLVACLFAVALPGWAANPSLDAYERGINDPAKHSKALRLGSLDIKVDIVGAIADTTLTAVFTNPGAGDLEGRFSFELPAEAVMTGYSLDINGALIDGVLVDPLKARREYQKKLRVRVDPGVAEVSRANLFSTTVYPIPAQGRRTIRLRFSAPIHPQRGFAFPLVSTAAVGNLTIAVNADSSAGVPQLTLPDNLRVDWNTTPDGSTANGRLQAQALTGELRVAPIRLKAAALLSRHGNGDRFFQIVDAAPAVAADIATGKRVRIYWDRSLSRRDDWLADELVLLDKYLTKARPASVDLVVFNSSGARVQRVTPGTVKGLLGGVLYRGATSFSVLDHIDAPAADVCLVFSDGVVTIDPRNEFKPGCEVFAISSAADADNGFLRRLARDASAVLHLDRQKEEEILARLFTGGPRVVAARAEDGRALRFASVDGGAHGWAVVGEAPAQGAVILRIAGLGREIVERRYLPVPSHDAKFAGAGSLWAADRVAQLGAQDDSHEELVQLSRRFSVASPALAFIVLENPADYVQAEIEPPANYPKESREEYRGLKVEFDTERKSARDERLGAVIEQWEEEQKWWSTKFDPHPPKQIAEKRERTAAGLTAQAAMQAAPAPMESRANRVEGAGVVDAIAAEDIGSFEEVAVTGARGAADKDGAGPDISVNMENWSPDRPYLKALDAAAPAAVDRALAREEQKYSALPVFYFDVAEWLYRKQRNAEAIEMLLSALELPVSNQETVSMVADRLLRYRRVDRAIWLYSRAAEQSDYLPQPRRTLALALAKRAATARPDQARADLTRAVQLLNEIVTTPWDGSFDGIELVALMEVNELLPRLQKLGVGRLPLDERLRALLDVDIRVIIEWNTDATDMDLWVDEPTGERAIYSNPRTAIGGRLSNDMTEGLGPEEYLLHRAVPGEYKISVNVFAADSINPNGSTFVTAHLFRNFGRTTQVDETMELELKPDVAGLQTIGTFRVN